MLARVAGLGGHLPIYVGDSGGDTERKLGAPVVRWLVYGIHWLVMRVMCLPFVSVTRAGLATRSRDTDSALVRDMMQDQAHKDLVSLWTPG